MRARGRADGAAAAVIDDLMRLRLDPVQSGVLGSARPGLPGGAAPAEGKDDLCA